MSRKRKYKIGEVFETNSGFCKIVGVDSGVEKKNRHVIIEWMDDFKHRQSVRVDTLKTGSIRNPFYRGVLGVGYLGVGVYDHRDKELYNSWSSMLARCYRDKLKEKYPNYLEVHCCAEWHNFQNYAKFYKSCPYRQTGWHLDKDLRLHPSRTKLSEFLQGIKKQVRE